MIGQWDQLSFQPPAAQNQHLGLLSDSLRAPEQQVMLHFILELAWSLKMLGKLTVCPVQVQPAVCAVAGEVPRADVVVDSGAGQAHQTTELGLRDVSSRHCLLVLYECQSRPPLARAVRRGSGVN